MAVLAYFLFFIPLLAKAHKTSPFVKFHANQGTVLFVVMVLWRIAQAVLSSLLLVLPAVYTILAPLLNLASMAFFVLFILGIRNALKGQTKPLPVIGRFTILK